MIFISVIMDRKLGYIKSTQFRCDTFQMSVHVHGYMCFGTMQNANRWECSFVGRASDRHSAERWFESMVRQGIFLFVCLFFSPRVNFHCKLSYGARTPLFAIACIDICTHVQDITDHVRVGRIMDTLKHPSFFVG